MKVSDYIVKVLVDKGIKHIFTVAGAACLDLIHSVAKNKDIDYICVKHEQAGAMAADAYSRITGNIGATLVTSGPGGTNLITGTCCLKGTKIGVVRGPNKKIEDVGEGDGLIAYDEESGELVETTVAKTMSRTVNELIKITFGSGKELCITHNHPLFVNGKWIEAGNLDTGSEVLVIDWGDKISLRNKLYNPMKDPEVSAKAVQTNRDRGQYEEISRRMKESNPMKKPEVVAKIKGDFNSMRDPKIAKKSSETHKRKIVSGDIVPWLCTDEGRGWVRKHNRGRSHPRYGKGYLVEGERNPNWKGGLSFEPYSPEFNEELKTIIRERDGRICQLCGKTTEENSEKLSVHHIDYNKKNSVPENLISLCRSCNLKVNSGREQWTAYFAAEMNGGSPKRPLVSAIVDCPHYVRVEKIDHIRKEVTVYNFECFPYDNYFAEYVLVHNCCSYYDSIPVIHLNGQVFSNFTKGNLPLRQVGFQETDVSTMFRSVTKYAKMIKDPNEIGIELEKAFYNAKSKRPGPVLMDIPMDIQRMDIDEKKFNREVNELKTNVESNMDMIPSDKEIEQCIELLSNAERPVLLVGGGIRIGNAVKELYKLVDQLQIPVVSTWVGMDLFPEDHPLYRGKIGTYGQRGANFTIQNADVVLALGTRIAGRQTGGRINSFAREAKRIIVDIDGVELSHQQVKGHLNIQCDVKMFLKKLHTTVFTNYAHKDTRNWTEKTLQWKKKYPVVLPGYYKEKDINPYVFIKTLSEVLEEGDIIVTDCGANIVETVQAFEVKKNQRVITAWAHSPMGYSMAAVIGASFANPGKRIICIIGDGGMQMNIQELETIKYYNLPIKIFILNNHCYGIQRQFQNMYFNGKYESTDSNSGYSVPDFCDIAGSYGIPSCQITAGGLGISNYNNMKINIKSVLDTLRPEIFDIDLGDNASNLLPRIGWNCPIEDMYPYLPRDEFMENMYIEPLKDSGGWVEQKKDISDV